MAAVPVTIIGTLTDSEGTKNVTLAGLASISGLEVGGGPIMPGDKPEIWPRPGHPAHPIVIPPDIWPNPPDPNAPHPEHPIVIPHPPVLPQAPDLQVKVVWTAETGWAVILVPMGPVPTPSSGGRRG